ncbi:hypothetical protein J2S74_000458 [Evansella vedderi]|uniref:Phosphodiester glycosidase domain-containing protein n=1 Tax=Evansella vedderi TaxID=38282 RepID=A0ABT9ZPB8_9BACI|nr:phosphodiester glycosidase family protein [Evansella vedderi]MDQ0253086.1 hypothetical protein [Evansella vedderi]
MRYYIILIGFVLILVGCGSVEEVVLEQEWVSSPHLLLKSDNIVRELQFETIYRFETAPEDTAVIEDEEESVEDAVVIEDAAIIEDESLGAGLEESNAVANGGDNVEKEKRRDTEKDEQDSKKDKVEDSEDAFFPEEKKVENVEPRDALPGGTYRKFRYFDSDVHVYVSGPGERLAVTNGGVGSSFRPLSGISLPNEVAKINFGFFGGEIRHIGMYLVDGSYTSTPDDRFVDLHYYRDGRIEIKNYGSDLASSEVERLREETYFVVGTSYSVVQNGVKNLENAHHFNHSTQRRPRTVFGQRSDGRFLFVVVDGGSRSNAGVTAEQSAEIMLDLGSVQAVNLDGGGSSTFIVDGVLKNRPSDGFERNIGSAMFLVR